MARWILRQGGKARIGHAKGIVEEVKDDKGKNDEPAHRHAARGEGGFDDILAPIALGSGATIFERELDRVIDVDQDHGEEKGADEPEKWS